MKKALLVAAAVAALAFTAAASPASSRWSKMTLTEKQELVQHTIQHDRQAVRWWLTHRPQPDRILTISHIRMTVPGRAKFPRCKTLDVRAPAQVCERARELRHATQTLGAINEQIRVSALPSHLSLWRCIERGESGGDGTNHGYEGASNGSHFNVLQMTNPWYGIHPIGLSYSVIEMAAEREYAASGYSSAWLTGQWGQTIGPCWGYA